MNKEQVEMIENEADIDVDKAPVEYMNAEAYAWKFGYQSGYIAGRTKSMELENACRELLNAPHYEHFAARLNDEEMAALNKIKQLLNQTP